MKKVALYGQSYSINSKNEIAVLLSVLEEKKVSVIIEKQFYSLLKEINLLQSNYPTFTSYTDIEPDIDFFFSLGGDGTMLRAVTYVKDLNIPLLGINVGRLGFLATVNKNEIKKSLEFLFNNNFSIQERSLLKIDFQEKDKNSQSNLTFALNEITISRQNTTSMIGVKTSLDGEHLTTYWSDGLIIATPTGSTGYSLSCNGPVISPKSKSFVITPIAPHNLNSRPMVIPDDTQIEIEVDSRESNFLISLDSRLKSVPSTTKVTVKKADFSIKKVVLPNQSFLKTLRTKLLWGEDTRNESV